VKLAESGTKLEFVLALNVYKIKSKETETMTEHDIRKWFGHRGYPLNEEVKLTFSVVKKCGQNWLFLKDDCHAYEGCDEVESYYLDTNFCEPYDGWKAKGFSWRTEDLGALIDINHAAVR